MTSDFDQMVAATASHRAAVLDHPVYAAVRDLRSLRTFMEYHVVAVWDFMTLLKSMQRRLTCVELPWRPAPDSNAARLVNEIVTVEESDEVAPGRFLSHFEIYLEAMREAGASPAGIESLMRPGLASAAIPDACPGACKSFVRTTFAHAEGPVHVSAAAFLMGREDLVPAMFERMAAHLPPHGQDHFRFYLRRHMQVDGDVHGPMARKLLGSLCGHDMEKWGEATRAAIEALDARRDLWDAIFKAIS